MSLEQNIIALTAALEANTAALLGAAAPASKPAGKPAAEKPAAKAKPAAKPASKHTREDVKAAAVRVVDQLGKPAAKSLISQFATELAAIEESQFDDFMEAVETALAGEGDGDGSDGL